MRQGLTLNRSSPPNVQECGLKLDAISMLVAVWTSLIGPTHLHACRNCASALHQAQNLRCLARNDGGKIPYARAIGSHSSQPPNIIFSRVAAQNILGPSGTHVSVLCIQVIATRTCVMCIGAHGGAVNHICKILYLCRFALRHSAGHPVQQRCECQSLSYIPSSTEVQGVR